MSRTFGPMLEAARIQSEINRLFDNQLDLGAPGKESGASNFAPASSARFSACSRSCTRIHSIERLLR